MRIISGIYKNREIMTPDSSKTHPMGSREKLALFNMISSYLPQKRVLDAFSGSGALGLEAISRGASSVVFVENDKKAAEIIKKNLKNLGENAEKSGKVLKTSVENLMSSENLGKFDLIFADPPYEKYDKALIEKLSNYLSDDGILALSHPKGSELPNLEVIKEKSYARCGITLLAGR